MSVTDHDTVAALADVRALATKARVELVDGIEITSVHEGRDVHILGYFIDAGDAGLAEFLRTQRTRRVERLREIAARLARLGAEVNVDDLLAIAARKPGTSVGRPVIARALIAAGHVQSMNDAFDRYLAAGQPAFVPRIGPSPPEVVGMIHKTGGLASMAHPGVTNQPDLMAALVDSGLDAIEVFHSDHTPEIRHELQVFAARHQLLLTGGSDFHGDDDRGRPLGGTTLPAADFAALQSAARVRRR